MPLGKNVSSNIRDLKDPLMEKISPVAMARKSGEDIYDEETGEPLWKMTNEEGQKIIRGNWVPGAKRHFKGWKKTQNGEYEPTYWVRK